MSPSTLEETFIGHTASALLLKPKVLREHLHVLLKAVATPMPGVTHPVCRQPPSRWSALSSSILSSSTSVRYWWLLYHCIGFYFVSSTFSGHCRACTVWVAVRLVFSRVKKSDLWWYGYGSIPINTIFRGMNIHLPAILMFTRGIGFWPIPICGHSIWGHESDITQWSWARCHKLPEGDPGGEGLPRALRQRLLNTAWWQVEMWC